MPIDDYVDEIFFLSKLSTKTYMDFFAGFLLLLLTLVLYVFRLYALMFEPHRRNIEQRVCFAELCCAVLC